ncbi:uncharacterized protein LOC134530689 isoform X2 [Bacillus rossius redtenbacheri]|uniref:uncharacterized protein LOC134530689 isoform X2 n=1 Tax=Bacillus rossius redtenbacheri TaxID=93214 RepID=UPI002FDC90D4
MPTTKVPELYQLCLENLVHNGEFWLKKKADKKSSQPLNNSFESLPSSFQQDLLDTYERIHSHPGRCSFWQEQQEKWRLFVTSQVCKLTITEYTEKASLLHIAATCRNLKHLELKYVKEVLSYLKAISPCLCTIVTLDFETMAHVNSTSLKYIRNRCPKLRVLILRSCFLTDKSISQLKHLPTLTELDLRDTEVTAAGVSHVLRNNPQLRTLLHPEVGRALQKMHSAKTWLVRVEMSLFAQTANYRLREIELELCTKDHCNMLAMVVLVCPHIERVRVEFDARISSQALLPLAKLKRLSQLDVQCISSGNRKPWEEHQSESMTLFEGSIVPILKSHGNQLSTVSLEGIVGVNMKILQDLCTRLMTLGLYYNWYLHDSFPLPKDLKASKPFPTLKRLLFGSNFGNDDFPAVYLEWLLSNANLEELSLSASPLFTDDLFTRVFANSLSFPHLRSLELAYCNVTPELIVEFLARCGRKALQKLSICGPFVREQAPPAMCYIICEKLDVHVEAYSYSFVKIKKRIVRYKQDLSFVSSPQHSLESRHHHPYLDVKKQWRQDFQC